MADSPELKRPQVLLIDLSEECEAELLELGLDVRSGTFGTPYTVPKKDEWQPVAARPELDGYNESDIIVVDLAYPQPRTLTDGRGLGPPGVKDWWANGRYGMVDPRPKAMSGIEEHTRRLFERRGGLIIFAAASPQQNFVWARKNGDGSLSVFDDISGDSWSFLDRYLKTRLSVRHEDGKHVTVSPGSGPLGAVLSRHLVGVRFSCRFGCTQYDWTILAVNMNGHAVAGVLSRPLGGDDPPSFLLLLPQLPDKAAFLKDLFRDALPEVFPHLFPDAEELKWIQRPEYEQVPVLKVREEIRRVSEDAERTLADLEESLKQARKEYWYLDDALTGTGVKLVKAVAECLRVLGFEVTDCDAEAAGQAKREDLRIEGKPLLLIEVKGISGLPADAEAHQSFGYIAPTMQELERHDVHALSIINHQRHLPPLERNNSQPFRGDIIANAEHHEFGLLTAWDLYRLTRSFTENGWQHEDVRPLFYLPGRIDPVPTHYELLGTVPDGAVFEDGTIVGFEAVADLSFGDRIAFDLPTRFREQEVTSMHVEGRPVEAATAGQEVSVETVLTKEEARKGLRIFRVRR